MEVPQKLIELPYVPAVPLLSIYMKEYIYEISLSKIYLSIAALFTIVKIYRNNLRVH